MDCLVQVDMCRLTDCTNSRDCFDVNITSDDVEASSNSDDVSYSESDYSSDGEEDLEEIDEQNIEEDCEIDNIVHITLNSE